MAKILLDYAFPITVITPTPAASTAFLKQVCVIAKPKSGQEGNVGEIFECTSMSQVAVRTDNTNSQQLFDAGMSKVFVLLSDELDVPDAMTEHLNEFYTVLISDDYTDADVTATAATGTVTISNYANLIDTAADTVTVAGVGFVAQAGAATLGEATFRAASSNDDTAASLAAQINGHAVVGAKVTATVLGAVVTITSKLSGVIGNTYTLTYTDGSPTTVGASVSGSGTLTGGDGMALGPFEGVVGHASDDDDFAAAFAAVENQCGFFTKAANGANNMFYAFGSMLSNAANWRNQQYISMPLNDDVDELGEANALFDNKVSFVIHDDEFANRLALFACGGKAIVAPYILKNLRLDMQSKAVQWISANQPQYTLKNASLLEARLQEDVINSYIARGLIESGSVEITLVEDNFVANGDISVPEPKALWRVVNEMTQPV